MTTVFNPKDVSTPAWLILALVVLLISGVAGGFLNLNERPVAVAPEFISGTGGQPINFDATESYDPDGSVTSYFWNFGDGEVSDSETVFHIYDRPGTYTVTLTITDDRGASDKIILSAHVNLSQPVAVAGSDISSHVGNVISFDASGSRDPLGAINKFTWNFGDGEILEGKTVNHSYSKPGSYVVILNVNSTGGGADSDERVITIINDAPIVDAGEDRFIFVGFEEDFSAKVSDIENNFDFMEWNFGDGTVRSGNNLTHTYETFGEFIVFVTAYDKLGATGTDSFVVRVGENHPPIAEAGLSTTVKPNTLHQFVGSASDPDGTIVFYEWDFEGDGIFDFSSATNGVAVFSFADEGDYTSVFRATDEDGDSTSDELFIKVRKSNPPVAVAGGNQRLQYNWKFNFDASGSFDEDGNIVLYKWDFGNGFFISSTNPTANYVYNTSGRFIVTLTVTDNEGLKSDDTLIAAPFHNNDWEGKTREQLDDYWEARYPKPALSFFKIAPLTFTLFDAYTDLDGWLVKREWDFNNDGVFDQVVESTDESVSIDHRFNVTDNYFVKLRVTDNLGNIGEDTALISAS